MPSTKYLIVHILPIALSLASCRTPRQAALQQQQYLQESVRGQEQQIHRLQQQISLLLTQTTQQQTTANRRTRNEENDLAEIITEEFDTTQPVDTATGTPPLKSRRTEKREHKAQALATQTTDTRTEQHTALTANVQQATEDSLTTDCSIDREKETQTDARQHTGLNWWQTTLCTIGAACIIALLIWICIKILKHYIKPI